MEQSTATTEQWLVADALHRVADLMARGRVTVLGDGWHISAYDYLGLAGDIVDAMDVTESKAWRGVLIGRDCRTVIGTLAGHPVRLTFTTDDRDWHGPKVGELAATETVVAR